jgi:hypothetical protein
VETDETENRKPIQKFMRSKIEFLNDQQKLMCLARMTMKKKTRIVKPRMKEETLPLILRKLR